MKAENVTNEQMLETLAVNYDGVDDLIWGALKAGALALRENKAFAPIPTKSLYRDEIIEIGFCKCEAYVNETQHYCHECGQRLDWEVI